MLKTLESSDFLDQTSIPQPYLEGEDLDPVACPPFELPSILVPPEVIELDGLAADAGEESQAKKEEWPEYWMRLFDNAVGIQVKSLSIFDGVCR